MLPLAAALVELGRDRGVPVKLRLCDTLGLGLPWREAELPRSVPRLVQALERPASPRPSSSGTATTISARCTRTPTAAWLAGCAAVNGTLGGIGERTGNEPIELPRSSWPGSSPAAGST